MAKDDNITEIPSEQPTVAAKAEAPAKADDGTVSVDFGNGNVLTGVTVLGGSNYGPNGEVVNALLAVDGGHVPLAIPARFLVK